jgi:hypothetical protein
MEASLGELSDGRITNISFEDLVLTTTGMSERRIGLTSRTR